ncbi:MAG: HD domain-containing protein [Pseudomonadales bacterium]|jgi:HD-GYP domain-containing protein (c-di-GMP phosphodiesterase class II)|nr:HD domain-containing protein [Pseudomonadales bacterium]
MSNNDIASEVFNPKEDWLVATLSRSLAKRCKNPEYSEKMITIIHDAAALHDVGKAKVSAELINSPNKLTAVEFDTVKLHTIYGREMLASLPGEYGEMARLVAEYHHEYYDGSKSYWGKIAKDELPVYVQIVTLADSFITMISKRPYKKPMSLLDALAEVERQKNIHFNPDLADILIGLPRVECLQKLYDAAQIPMELYDD